MKYKITLSDGKNIEVFADGYDISSVGVLSLIHVRNINGQVHGVFMSSFAAGQWLRIDELEYGRPVYEQTGDIIPPAFPRIIQ